RMVWQEYQAPAALTIPFIDLSIYSDAVGKQLATELYHKWILEEMENATADSPTLLYRLLLIRETPGELILILACDHTIFDGMSGEIIKRQIMDHYRCRERNIAIPEETVHSYGEYIQQLDKGPQGINEAEVIALFELGQYRSYKSRVEDVILRETTESYRYDLHYEFPMQEGLGEETAWEFAFTLFSRVLSRYFEIPRVPVKILSYGRHYGDKGYFNTVGEFLDLIPILTPAVVAAERAGEISEYTHKRIEMAAKYAINFIGLQYNPYLKENWKKAATLIFPEKIEPTDQMIMFNFIGKLSGKEAEKMKTLAGTTETKREQVTKEGSTCTIFCGVTYTTEVLNFNLSSTLAAGAETLKKLIEEEVSGWKFEIGN
ncbi:MAG: hypothetical protein GY757_29490, partial [bacterium]|nr:hypothetical protein [bacterium]